MFDLELPTSAEQLTHCARLVTAIRKQLQEKPREDLTSYLYEHATDISATGQVMRQLILQAMNAQAAAARADRSKK